jgi:hypothetical protein
VVDLEAVLELLPEFQVEEQLGHPGNQMPAGADRIKHTLAAVAAVPVQRDRLVQNLEDNVELAELELQHQ